MTGVCDKCKYSIPYSYEFCPHCRIIELVRSRAQLKRYNERYKAEIRELNRTIGRQSEESAKWYQREQCMNADNAELVMKLAAFELKMKRVMQEIRDPL